MNRSADSNALGDFHPLDVDQARIDRIRLELDLCEIDLNDLRRLTPPQKLALKERTESVHSRQPSLTFGVVFGPRIVDACFGAGTWLGVRRLSHELFGEDVVHAHPLAECLIRLLDLDHPLIGVGSSARDKNARDLKFDKDGLLECGSIDGDWGITGITTHDRWLLYPPQMPGAMKTSG